MTMMQRILFAWLASALVPGLILSLYLILMSGMTDYDWSNLIIVTIAISLIIFVVASLHILILGLPVFYRLEERGILNIWTASLSGLLIAGTPAFIFTIFSETLSWWSIGGSIIFGYGLMGPFGLIGGISAWAAWRYTTPKEMATETVP
ncbi:hypothetical protein Q1W73_11635 [Asticcacaulis sp. ZE23SCel15]|uniref:hypothetical protein n=1 Tax=Asticcacaulis sp. ZE23SCel15 TaxID=3059027 RepID=UPI00265ECF94|nr:hypothetical protein [Asticcacaulis sp. ZE23SCel15]WKL56339.1 hypothetical protein Q1W73_11635 [Asticcacaulis sp. ZE23SCel15]